MRRTRKQSVMIIRQLSRRVRRLSEEDTEEIAIGGPVEPDAGGPIPTFASQFGGRSGVKP
jgi:hypothetical protein